MRNIKLTVEYDGSRYQGYARLGKDESTNTIANKITEVIKKMTGEDVELFCGMRTEVGVHAYAQVLNFKTNSDMKRPDMLHYLNRYLPMDIAVINLEDKPERFHASLNAVSKTFTYRIAIGDAPSVFERKYVYHMFKSPDVAAMKQAALLLIGTHDFKNFSTVKKSKSTVKEVLNIDIYSNGSEMEITIEAKDFLHNMARMMIGTLLDIGLGVRKKEDIDDIFKGILPASTPADAKGLYLQEVKYEV